MTQREIELFLESSRSGRLSLARLRQWWGEHSQDHVDPSRFILTQTGYATSICSRCRAIAWTQNLRSIDDSRQYWCKPCTDAAGRTCTLCNVIYDGNITHIHRQVVIPTNEARQREPMVDGMTAAQFAERHVSPYSTPVEQHTGFFHTAAEAKVAVDGEVRNGVDPLLYFGIELEVQRRPDAPADIARITDLSFALPRTRAKTNPRFAMLKRDRSIGETNFEIVSGPATLDYHLGGAWDRFFSDAARHLIADESEACGLHFHISTAPLSHMAMGRLLLMVNEPENLEFMQIIAGRTLTYDHQYCKLTPNMTIKDVVNLKRHSNQCPWSVESRMVFRMPRRFFATNPDGSVTRDDAGRPILQFSKRPAPTRRARCTCGFGRYSQERHEAVNLATNKQTMEIRVFRSTIVPEILFARLEAIAAMTEYCRIIGGIAAPNAQKFVKWIRYERRKRYPHLMQLLIDHKLVDPVPSKPAVIPGKQLVMAGG